MNNELKSILDEYAHRRAAEETRVNKLLKMLIAENPVFKKAREEYSSIRAKEIRAKLEGKVFDIEKAKSKYNSSLNTACKKCGIKTDDLKIKYECKDCMDTGYIGQNKKSLCHCVVNTAASNAITSQNLLDDATFDNFDQNIFPNNEKVDKEGRSQREHMLYMKSRAEKWCSDFPATRKMQVLLIGTTGVGKSYMVSCIAHNIIKKGYSVVNATASGINEAKLKAINERDTSIMGLFKSCSLLIIDDLGAESTLRNITVETLYEIIEYRLANKKHTILCTNLTMINLQERYGYRITSRLSSPKNTALMQLLGKDIRSL